MTRDSRADKAARRGAPEPSEPVGESRTTMGTIKFWRRKGFGAIASEATAPWDIWCHFTVIATTGGTPTASASGDLAIVHSGGGGFSPKGGRQGFGYTQYTPGRPLKAGERVEVDYRRENRKTFKYVATHMRRFKGPTRAA